MSMTNATMGVSSSIPVSATLITIAGIATGLPNDLIFPGFAGSLWAIKSAEESSMFWRIVQLMIGTLLAAWATHPLLYITDQIFPVLSVVPPDVLKYPVAMVIGWGGLTRILKWLEERSGAQK